jgi:hypothetical protein
VTGGERAAGDLLRQPRFADARLADDEHEPAHPVRNVVQCQPQHRKLARAADHGIGAAGLAR